VKEVNQEETGEDRPTKLPDSFRQLRPDEMNPEVDCTIPQSQLQLNSSFRKTKFR